VRPFWPFPTELRVLPDGTWKADGLTLVHGLALRYLKAHLVWEPGGAAVVDGAQRMGVRLEGPPLEVQSLEVDTKQGRVRAHLDDGSSELVGDGAIAMSETTGRFEFQARGGQFQALLSRGAHETLLASVEESDRGFVIAAGSASVTIRT
jgi:hypothetical protein